MPERSDRPDADSGEEWMEEDLFFYTVVQTPSGFIAVMLAVDEGQLVYDSRALFPNEDEAEKDLRQRIALGGGEETGLKYIPPQLLFSRMMTLILRREISSEGFTRTG